MSIRPEVRRIVMEAIAHVRQTDGAIVGRAEIDTVCWVRRVRDYLHDTEAMAFEEIRAASSDHYLQQMIGEYIRQSRDVEVDNLWSLDGLRKNVRQQQRIVQIRKADGAYVAKELRFCSPEDLETLADQYKASGEADLRRGKFYRNLAAQARELGLGEAEPLQRLLV